MVPGKTQGTSTPQTPGQWRARVLALAVPIMLSNITVPLVGMVDTAVMGRMPSPVYISATAVGAVLFSTIFWAFGFLRMGTGGMVAQALGANDAQSLYRTTIRALIVALALGVLLIVLGSPLLAAGLWVMQGSAELQALTRDYFAIRILAAPATLMTYAIFGSLIGQQRMRSVFALQLLLNCLNIVLNLTFFTLTDWNIKGVAIATVISEYVTLFAGLILLKPVLAFANKQNIPQHDLHGRESLSTNLLTGMSHWLFDRQPLLEFFQISGNIFIRSLCLTVAYYWLTVMGARQGDTVLAANAVLLHLLHLMAHGLDGFSHAAESLCGHAYGQRNRQAFSNASKACTFWAGLLAVLVSLVYLVSGGHLIDMMTTQPQVRELARQWLPWIAIGPIIGVWSFLLDGIFIGTTHTREMRNGMLVSLAVFVVATQVLIPPFGNNGLWMAYHVLMISRAVTLGAWLPRIVRTFGARSIT